MGAISAAATATWSCTSPREYFLRARSAVEACTAVTLAPFCMSAASRGRAGGRVHAHEHDQQAAGDDRAGHQRRGDRLEQLAGGLAGDPAGHLAALLEALDTFLGGLA